MQIRIPYGKTFITAQANENRVLTAKTNRLMASSVGSDIVREAMDHPIHSPHLSELAKDKKNAVLILSDHTRPVPSRDIVPNILADLRKNNPTIDITLLVATGFHRATGEVELRQKLGDDIVDHEKIVVHDSCDEKNLVHIGTLPSGAPLIINRLAAETELLVSEGFIEPHFFAGFSGGRKSVLPGISARKTVFGNHCGAFIANPNARSGILDKNPVHTDMEAAAEMANLRFIVNVVINDNKETIVAFAGDFRTAHRAGAEFLRRFCEVEPVPGDIVVTGNGGFPLDQNLYQCVKCMTAAELTVRENGIIIVCAEAIDGIGGNGFFHALADCVTPEDQYRIFSETPQCETKADQWQAQILCRILAKHRVIVVTRKELCESVTAMKMEYAESLDEALKMAGKGDITWIPNGISLIIKPTV